MIVFKFFMMCMKIMLKIHLILSLMIYFAIKYYNFQSWLVIKIKWIWLEHKSKINIRKFHFSK